MKIFCNNDFLFYGIIEPSISRSVLVTTVSKWLSTESGYYFISGADFHNHYLNVATV